MKLPIQPKFLAFYGSTLVLVLLLFRWITTYGEANLQAPPNLSGRYMSTTVPPGCPADYQLVLTLEQSGIYLNGDLALEQGQQTVRSAAHAPTLKGRWQKGQIALTGRTSAFATCSTSTDRRNNRVTVQGNLTHPSAGDTAEPMFTGQLTLPDAQVWTWAALRQPATERSSDH